MSDEQPENETLPFPVVFAMQSQATGQLADALAKAQSEIEQPQKNKTATIEGKSKATGKAFRYSYTYADLPTVLEHLKKALPKHGLSYVQRTRMDNNRLVLDTILMHSSGEWISSQWPLQVSTDPKETAALLTYGRRYSLSSLCGISAEETDDDAERKFSGKAEPVTGRFGKTQLKDKMRAFSTDLHSCTDTAMLEGVLVAYNEACEQCEREMPSWWYTQHNSDAPGYADQIAAKRKELETAEASGQLGTGQREGPQEPAESPRRAIVILRPQGGQREFPATNAGALEALSDLEAQCAINPDAWQANKAMILHMAQLSKNAEVKKRALALEKEMEQPVLTP